MDGQRADPGKAGALLARWRERPDLFAVEVLGVKPWDRQVELMLAIAKHRRVVVRSGHKCGKSDGACYVALWFVMCFPQARVIMTAPTGRQVRAVLWKALQRVYRKAKVPLGGIMHDAPNSGLQFPDGREILGFSTDEPEKMAGISGPNVLFIVDEASGVDRAIYEAIEGNMAGGARALLCSNPTQTSGVFYDAFGVARQFWHCIHISSADAAKTGIPGLATAEWIEEKRLEWGERSPLYQVRVLGEFPTEAQDAVMSLGVVDLAGKRWGNTVGEGPLHIGVDVARFGDDDSVIQGRRGYKAFAQHVISGADTVAVAGQVLKYARDMRKHGERPIVKVDTIGVGGGVADILRTHDPAELTVIDINVSERSDYPDEYPNLRSQLWFALSDWLAEGGTVPPDTRLEAELIAPTYTFDLRGRRKVESKDDIKKRLGRSPDRADALALAAYSRPPRATGTGYTVKDWEQQAIGE